MTAALLNINRRAFASLRIHRNYRLYFLGQAISQTGTWIDKVAQAWLVLALTHSAFAVGLLAACQFVPFSVLGLIAGVVVDRLDVGEVRARQLGERLVADHQEERRRIG